MNSQRRMLLALLLATFLSAYMSTQSIAGLIVTLESDQISYQVGDSGTLRLYIAGVDEELDGFLAGVTISGGTGIIFDTIQSDSFMEQDADYVFHGRSSNVTNGTPLGTVTIDALGVDFLDVSDNGLGGSDPFQFTNNSRLLAQFTFQALSAGDFVFELAAGSTFNDSSLALLDVNSSSIQVQVTAVPEPSILLAFALLLVRLGFSGPALHKACASGLGRGS